MRYFVYFSYKGTAYHGWQRQQNAITVQEIMEDAFALILRHHVSITGAGRTDTGVHAEQMVAHFDLPDTQPLPDNFANRLNNLLPRDITIQQFRRVIPEANARFAATSRTYEYRCLTQKSSFNDHNYTLIPADLDFELMNEAAKILLVTKDFASFCKYHTDVKTTFCHVTRADWRRRGETEYVFTITADRFLRNMVRAVVGTLFEVGKHRMTLEQFQHIIDLADRQAASQSALADGLYLTHVSYPDDIFLDQNS